MLKHPVTLTLIGLLALATSAEAGKIHPGHCKQGKPQAIVKASNGSGAPVHPSAVQPFKCVLDGLERARIPIAFVYGYACRSLPTSNHPRGLAIDVNQHSRDVTRPVVNRHAGLQIARNCGVTSGAQWRNPDNGHFEIRSSSRAQQQARRPARTQQQWHQPRPRQQAQRERHRYYYEDWVALHRQQYELNYQ